MASSDSHYSHTLHLFKQPQHLPLLAQLQRGVEKEGLRCSSDGVISQRQHPKGLGASLTHPSITTDYSEALLEFITPVFKSAHEALAHLDVAHRYAYSQINGELIWPNSMPCIVQGEMSIPIAEYGNSHLGQLKHVYRHGLWHRYGRTMQCIAGIHYNFSMPDEFWPAWQQHLNNQDDLQAFISDQYFGLIRNFRRYSWLLFYLFGASPAVCGSFLQGREHNLQPLRQNSLYAPYATTLRMSDLGYQNNAQSDLVICYNSVERYIDTLGKAIQQPVKQYEALGIKDEQGRYKQLNTNLLQIENEYYSDIRPKRVAPNGEKPLQALDAYGVQYIEVRCTDLNPFMPLGIDVPQMQFMDLFLTWCLLQDSPEIDDGDFRRIQHNQHVTAMEGRKPGLLLQTPDGERSLTDWGLDVLADMQSLAKLMDTANGHCFHQDSLAQQRLKLADSNLTPSAKLLACIDEQALEFSELNRQLAQQHRKQLSEPLAPDVKKHWQQLAQQSLTEQSELEASDTGSFDDYLSAYLNS